jgi:hypothetical protein
MDQRINAIESARFFVKNLVGGILIFGISLATLKYLLLPEILNLLAHLKIHSEATEWLLLTGGILISAFLLTFPIFLIVQAITLFQQAKNLERNGKLIKGAVVEKWVDTTGWQQAYYVCYKYFEDIYAIQKVAKDIFLNLTDGQKVRILMLEQLPHISRMFP